MANEAKQKLTVGPVAFPFLPSSFFLVFRKRTNMNWVDHWCRAFTCGLYYLCSSPRDSCHSASHQSSALPNILLPTTHDIHPSKHSLLLSQFLHLAPHLIQPGSSSTPTLKHPNLSLDNILLAPGSTKIISIIDWQDAVIFLRFMQAGYPVFCELDCSRPQSLQIPSLPNNFNEMSIDKQRQSRAIFHLEEASLHYTAATGVHNNQHMDVLKLPHLGMLQYLLRQTGYPWDADVMNLCAVLVGIMTSSVWSKISSAACPVVFSSEERETAIAESQEWNESEQLLCRIREHLNIDLEGGTEPDNVERAVEGNRQFRMEMVLESWSEVIAISPAWPRECHQNWSPNGQGGVRCRGGLP